MSPAKISYFNISGKEASLLILVKTGICPCFFICRILEKETEKEQVQKAHPDADDEAKETIPMLNLELEYLRKKRESLEQQYFFELDRNDEWKELEAKISAKKAPETGKYSPAFHDIRKEKERNPSERLHTKKDRGRSR